MQSRSIILFAFTLALIVSVGVLFQWVGVEPGQISLRQNVGVNDTPEEVGADTIEVSDDVVQPVQEEISADGFSEGQQQPGQEIVANGEVAGAQTVTPTAEAGAGLNISIGIVLAVIVGIGGLIGVRKFANI